MKNKEKFQKEILEIACDGHNFCVDRKGNVLPCNELDCYKCAFYGSPCCDDDKRLWADAEWKNTLKISKKDLDILNLLEKKWKWIARDEDGMLFVCEKKPERTCNFFGERYWDVCGGEYAVLSDLFGDALYVIRAEDIEPWRIEDLKAMGREEE